MTLSHHPASSVNPSVWVPEVRVLSDSAVVAIRSALQAKLRHYGRDGDLRHAIGMMCAEAKRHGLRAEQLVMLVKQAWQSLPEVHQAAGTQRDVLTDAISVCIDEFYRDEPARSD